MHILILGNKEFEVPALEPLHVKSLVIDAGTAPINLRQTLKNVMVTDMISTSKIQRYRSVLRYDYAVTPLYTNLNNNVLSPSAELI